MQAILELVGVLINVVARMIVIVVATPLVFLWPRQDKTLTYWQTVWLRCKKVLGGVA